MSENKPKLSKKFKITVSLCAVLIMILSFFCGFFTYRLIRGEKMDTLSWVVKRIDKSYYYDEGDGTFKTFSADDYADALVDALLDKYSDYYSKAEYDDVVATNKGNNYGVGISISSSATPEKEKPEIFSVSGNSPAYYAGLKGGDLVVAGQYKDGEKVEIKNKKQLSEFIYGAGEEYALFVDRGGSEPTEFILKKRVFVKSFVFYDDNELSLRFENPSDGKPVGVIKKNYNALDLDDKTAVIELSNFSGNASEQFGEAMEYMKERGKTKLILDLRKNGGGFMDILCDIASYLTYSDDGDSLISVVKDKDGDVEEFFATDDNFNNDIEKIVAIADDNTASASECLLGAMLYYERAFSFDNLVIEGDGTPAHTYGKGIMQTTYVNILDGNALKLTTAIVYQPDGKTTIHGKGIEATAENSVGRGKGLEKAREIIKKQLIS